MSVIQGVIVYVFPTNGTVSGNGIPENGITAKAMMAGASVMAGASAKTRRSDFAGTTSSLMSSLKTSAIGWRSPRGPTRRGPRRTCMNAITLRSSSVMYATISSRTLSRIAILIAGIRPQVTSVSVISLPVHASEDDVDRPDERHDVCDEVPLDERRERLQVHEARRAEAAAVGGLRAVALEVDAHLPARALCRVIDLGPDRGLEALGHLRAHVAAGHL